MVAVAVVVLSPNVAEGAFRRRGCAGALGGWDDVVVRAFEDLVAEAASADVAGWGFGWLDGRARSARRGVTRSYSPAGSGGSARHWTLILGAGRCLGRLEGSRR